MPRCLKCGKETDKLIDGLCVDCYLKYNPPKVKVSNIVKCIYCGRVRVGKAWKKVENYNRFVKVKPPYKLVEAKEDYLLLDLEGELIQYNLRLPINYGTCPDCGRAKSQYYESILQIRGERAKKIVPKLIEQYNIVTTKIEEKNGGLDLYITDYKKAELLAKKLKELVGGSVDKSFQLYSGDRQTSRDKYRTAIIFRESKFKEGDIIEYLNKKWRIHRITNKDIVLKSGNEIIKVPRRKLENYS